MLNETFSVIFKYCVVYYFSNVASNKILLSFLMTIEVWKDDCLTFAWCFCIAWRTGSWCTEITRGEGPNQQHSNNFIFRSIISFPLGIWFNLLKAAIASCQEPKWNCILECTTWCKNINFHAKNFLFEKWKFELSSKIKVSNVSKNRFSRYLFCVCPDVNLFHCFSQVHKPLNSCYNDDLFSWIPYYFVFALQSRWWTHAWENMNAKYLCDFLKQIIENGFNWFLNQINGRKIRLHWLNSHLPIFAQKSSYSSYVECGLDFWEAKGCFGLRFSCNKSGFGTAGFSENRWRRKSVVSETFEEVATLHNPRNGLKINSYFLHTFFKEVTF